MSSSGFSRIPIKYNPNYKPDGLKSYIWLAQKYSIRPTQGPIRYSAQENALVKQQADGSSGLVTADDQQNDSLYTCAVTIGGQTLNLDFDTGSSDLWVLSTELPDASTLASSHSIYDPSKSSTYQPMTGSTWKISYGDGSSASGDVGTDNVTLGGLTIQKQAIELAKVAADSFKTGVGDGLLGLAWPQINTVSPTPVNPPVQNMIAQQDIPSTAELFTAYLGSVKDANDPDKGESFYTFGYIDPDVVQASGQSITYTPVDNSQGFWMFDCPTGTVNGKTFNLTGGKTIADTGTTLLLIGDAECKTIYDAIPGSKMDQTAGGYVFPSNTATSDLPVITFPFGDTTITISKEDLGFSDAGNGMVFGGIQSAGNLGFCIFGDVWLRNVYCIFDVGNKQLGVVQRTEPTSTATGA